MSAHPPFSTLADAAMASSGTYHCSPECHNFLVYCPWATILEGFMKQGPDLLAALMSHNCNSSLWLSKSDGAYMRLKWLWMFKNILVTFYKSRELQFIQNQPYGIWLIQMGPTSGGRGWFVNASSKSSVNILCSDGAHIRWKRLVC